MSMLPEPTGCLAAPRKILLAVTGMSPQVVTETIFALATQRPQPWIPDEVHVLTTARGADNARLQLLSDQPGWFQRLRHDWKLPEMRFTVAQVVAIRRPDGTEVDDIRDDADNRCVADAIAEAVRAFTAQPGTELHASMAGGRKTMGYYLGYAMSLFGRPQDRLSHVLVSAPFEGRDDFFYPAPSVRVLAPRAAGADALDASRAQVWLADIPFVRLRQGLPRPLLEGRSSFAQAVVAAQGQLQPPSLRLRLHSGQAVCGGRVVDLPPGDLAFLAWFARRLLEGRGPQGVPKVEDLEAARDYLAEYRRIVPVMRDTHQTARRLAAGMDKAFFEQRKSKLKRLLVDALGEAAALAYLPRGQGRPMRFGLPLAPSAVDFTDEAITSACDMLTPKLGAQTPDPGGDSR